MRERDDHKTLCLEVYFNHHLRDSHFTSIKYLWSVGGKGWGLSL